MNTPDRNYNTAQIGWDFTHDGVGANFPAVKITSAAAPGIVVDVDGANPGLTIQGETTLGIDLSALGVADAILKATATTDSVTADPKTHAPTSWLKILIGSTANYIPVYTLSGS
jgi:hypothetical protein